jgi:hypothetical protein
MTKTKATRARNTLEYKQETVRLIDEGQSIARAQTLGMIQQTLFNWVSRRNAKASRPVLTANP